MENEDKLKDDGYFIISGYKGEDREEISSGQAYSIYKFLRKQGIKPIRIMVEGKSHDTLENVVYTLRKIRIEKKTKED